MKRWMLTAALGLTVAGAVVAPGAAQASSSAWYQVYQANVSGYFSQTAAIAKNDIWSVGRTFTRAGKTIYRPFIRHFNGSSWQAVTIPRSSGSTADWVSASGARDVWVGGLKKGPVATTVVHRWNGARWARIPVPALTALGCVTVLAPNDVWACGTSGTVAYDIFHWNGSRWRHYLPDYINFVPQELSASAPDNVWVSGFAYSGPKRSKKVVAAYRWNGRAWHRFRMPHPVLNNGGPGVTAVSRSNVWIGWYDNTSSHALHWDRRRWHKVTMPYFADPGDIVPDGRGGYWFGAQAILTGSTWTAERVPGFSGGFTGVTQIPGTTSFLVNAEVQAGGRSTEKPTIFRFDL